MKSSLSDPTLLDILSLIALIEDIVCKDEKISVVKGLGCNGRKPVSGAEVCG